MENDKKELINDFLLLLRSFIYSERPELTHIPDWDSLLKVAKRNGLVGAIGYVIISNGLCDNEKQRERWIELCSNAYGIAYRRYAQFERLSKMFCENDIEHLIVKGVVIRNYYPVKEFRSFSDIDFLIKKEDREKCHKMMIENGYKAAVDWEPIYSYEKDTEYYEIHTDIMYENAREDFDYSDYFSHSWERAIQIKPHVYVLKTEDHFIYLITHMAKHIGYAGAGIRMYLDLAVLINACGDSWNWAYIVSELKAIKLDRFADVVFTALHQWLDVNIPIPFEHMREDIMEKLLIQTVKGGTFGFANQSAGVVMLKKAESGENISRTKVLLSRTFPSADILEVRYKYLEGRHWLLPIAWVERFFQARKKLKFNIGNAKEIMMTDKHQIEEIRDFKKQIGL